MHERINGEDDAAASVPSGGQADGEGDGWDITVEIPARAGAQVAEALFDLIADTVHEAERRLWPVRDGWDVDLSMGPYVLAARPVLSREALLLALARADGQAWGSLAEADPHTAEVMYGKQADAVLDVLHPLDGGQR